MSSVKKIQKVDVAPMSQVLYHAFQQDAMNHWLFGDQTTYAQHGPAFYQACIDYCRLYGAAWRIEQADAVILWIRPKDSTKNLWRLWRSGMLTMAWRLPKAVRQRLMQLDQSLQAHRNNIMGHQPHWYCWVLGVAPSAQGQGLAGPLMQAGLDQANANGLPVYLEAATKKAEAIYQKWGFITEQTVEIVPGVSIGLMVYA